MNKILSEFNIITQTTTPQNTILHTPILELEFKLRNLIAYSNSRQFPGPLAPLPSEKVALVRHFRCTEFELRTCVAIALNKVHASSMETMCIRAPLVTSSWAQTPTAQGPQLRAPAALQCVWFPGLRHLSSTYITRSASTSRRLHNFHSHFLLTYISYYNYTYT